MKSFKECIIAVFFLIFLNELKLINKFVTLDLILHAIHGYEFLTHSIVSAVQSLSVSLSLSLSLSPASLPMYSASLAIRATTDLAYPTNSTAGKKKQINIWIFSGNGV